MISDLLAILVTGYDCMIKPVSSRVLTSKLQSNIARDMRPNLFTINLNEDQVVVCFVTF